jgi:Hemerythrin HHE cation binding domain
MTVPMDSVTAIHNAMRKDMAGVDAAALDAARGVPGSEPGLERYRFLNEVLVWHADGEEQAVFPAVDEVAPLVAEAYVQDHRGLDAAFDRLNDAVSAADALETARAAAAFRFHLDIHLQKEDTHLYRIVRERIPVPEQGRIAGVMASQIPPERQPELIAWLFPLIGPDDRENMVRIQQMVLPPEVFSGVAGLVRQAVGDDWVELTRRIPGLPT